MVVFKLNFNDWKFNRNGYLSAIQLGDNFYRQFFYSCLSAVGGIPAQL